MVTKSKLNISHLHWGFPPIIGGVETHLTIILPQMVKSGHNVSLLTSSVEGVNGDAIIVGSMEEVNTNGNWPKNYSSKQ